MRFAVVNELHGVNRGAENYDLSSIPKVRKRRNHSLHTTNAVNGKVNRNGIVFLTIRLFLIKMNYIN